MRPNVFLLAALFILGSGLYSCKKSETLPTATITVYSPTMNQVYMPGDTVRISAKIERETSLHGYHTAITNVSGDTLFAADSHEHAAVLTVDEYWINTLPTSVELTVSISSEINHEGLEVSKAVTIRTQ